ncbi:hypothetical protein, unlikely [Trypanosoma brucei gambiense DAL972]|uniref:Uncharacterized protein n=1 Tax=Trypanosoma brucei gambiense (strain MHOM/CI/86/DAL972) TaxID=679716 RepID=D0A7Q7_TRYB9|nr:hypothetical protein, unlikely [Trypanosoma brucei gambiense DAL972]CBH17708.1 hypothetical protein, unlikely [Trypanosoma brucei gambiense DAL972]|eukprot:XP_011779972.1 hypothetical protein, unlikely [Trypanosoma brucei gambiense DAL972]
MVIVISLFRQTHSIQLVRALHEYQKSLGQKKKKNDKKLSGQTTPNQVLAPKKIMRLPGIQSCQPLPQTRKDPFRYTACSDLVFTTVALVVNSTLPFPHIA